MQQAKVIVVTIGKREPFIVHQTARARIEVLRDLTAGELPTLAKVLEASDTRGRT